MEYFALLSVKAIVFYIFDVVIHHKDPVMKTALLLYFFSLFLFFQSFTWDSWGITEGEGIRWIVQDNDIHNGFRSTGLICQEQKE